MHMDDYNLHGYLLMCKNAYNLKARSIDGYGLCLDKFTMINKVLN